MTPEQRRQRARIAANARWSRYMAREDHAAVMKEVMRIRLEREVDPEGKLPPAERAKLVGSAAKRLAAELNAAKARKRAVQDRTASLPLGRPSTSSVNPGQTLHVLCYVGKRLYNFDTKGECEYFEGAKSRRTRHDSSCDGLRAEDGNGSTDAAGR